MRFKLLTLFLVFGAILFSQTADTAGSGRIIRIVHVHGDAGTLANLAGNGSGATVEGSDQLKAVVIKGRPAEVAAVESTIQQLDAGVSAGLGAKNIELIVYVIGGSMESISGVAETSGDALASVVKQLRAVFPYKNYQTLSTMIVRSGQGSKTISSGMIKTLQSTGSNEQVSAPSTYDIRYDSARISAETPPLIHLTGFRFDAKIPMATGMVPVGTATDVDLKEGQKVVVANSNLGNTNMSLFLVLTAHVVQ